MLNDYETYPSVTIKRPLKKPKFSIGKNSANRNYDFHTDNNVSNPKVRSIITTQSLPQEYNYNQYTPRNQITQSVSSNDKRKLKQVGLTTMRFSYKIIITHILDNSKETNQIVQKMKNISIEINNKITQTLEKIE